MPYPTPRARGFAPVALERGTAVRRRASRIDFAEGTAVPLSATMSALDPNNPIVRLCLEGMKAETDGRFTDAAECFGRAWAEATNDFEWCIAAHYVARHQKDAAETLRWNQVALKHALAVGDASVDGFYASLYLNLGYSYERAGDATEARRNYEKASASMGGPADARYTAIVQDAISRGLQRIEALDRE
jgi:tetratricopeptide (TPR) repeat protein